MKKKITFYLATTNQNKINEIKDFFKEHDFKFYTLSDFKNYKSPEETGNTFEENALIKAKSFLSYLKKIKKNSQENEWILAEDSGLEVFALKGAPGILSARYHLPYPNDNKNNSLLLTNLKNITKREARYCCSLICINFFKENVLKLDGFLEGCISLECKGSGGFGYDPLFIPLNQNQTLGELPKEYKVSVSHRAKVLKKFKKHLQI